MTSRFRQWSSNRRLTFGAVAVAAGAALFASGIVVARTTDGGDSAPSPVSATTDGPSSPPMGGTKVGAPEPAFGRVDSTLAFPGAMGSAGGTATDMPLPPSVGCGLVGDLLAGSTFDLAKAGFALRSPGDGYQLRGLSVRAQGPCDGSPPAKGDLVVESQWWHPASGLDVSVSQAVQANASASLLSGNTATFWAGGYAFRVSIGGMMPLVVAKAMPVPAPPFASDSGPTSGGGSSPGYPGLAPDDPRVAALLQATVARLGGPESQCFYRERAGGWTDLAALGIGDPRPAIPSSFREQYVNVRAFTSPAAGCASQPTPRLGGFDAGFAAGTNGEKGFLAVGAWPVQEGAPETGGFLGEGGGSWSNGRYQFSIKGQEGDRPLSTDTVRAIARALDPSFNDQCLVQTRTLAPSELAGLGFGRATAPAGYAVESEVLGATFLPAACATPPRDFHASYNLQWRFTKAELVIEAGASRVDGTPSSGPGRGVIYEGGLNWTDAKGTNYHVSGGGRGVVASAPSQETLIQVTKSMDPTLDPSKLEKAPTPGTKPRGMPVPAGASNP